jgi:hypothetical protein
MLNKNSPYPFSGKIFRNYHLEQPPRLVILRNKQNAAHYFVVAYGNEVHGIIFTVETLSTTLKSQGLSEAAPS